MQVTNEQLDKAARALREQQYSKVAILEPWLRLSDEQRNFYRSQVRAVLAMLPDAPEPIVKGDRKYYAIQNRDGRSGEIWWGVGVIGPQPGWIPLRNEDIMGDFTMEEVAHMLADALEREYRVRHGREGRYIARERWRIADGAPHRALGPGGKSVWFYMKPERGAHCDHKACAAFVARENARLDAEEGRNG